MVLSYIGPFFLAAGVALLLFYLYRKLYAHRVFKRLGIPGPDPHWLFGNTLQIFRDDRHLVIANWSAQYGDFFGIYYGALPIIVTRSPEAVEKVCVKQFGDFQGHMVWPITPDADKDPEHPQSHLFNSGGETWKRIHSILLPAFSTGRLKTFMSHIATSQADLLDYLAAKSKSGQAFDIREGYRFMTFEIIGKVAVSIDFQAIKSRGKGNWIFQNVRAYLNAVARPPIVLYASMIISELAHFFKFLIYTQMKFKAGFFGPMAQASEVVKQIVKQRRQAAQPSNDILQQMIDVSNNPAATKSINEREITAQCFLLFSAGNETTSIALSTASFLLAKNQHVQDKLAEELAKIFPRNENDDLPEIDYDIVMNKIPYLDWVCKESLRLYPSSMNLFSRYVENDTSLCGITVPKSIWGVLFDNWSIHYDPELWGPNTSDFVPERFSPENSANRPDSCFLSFGLGPRMCLGIRLAYLLMKCTLANVVLRYKIVEPDGGFPGGTVKFSSRSWVIAIEEIPLRLVPRQ